MGTNTIELTTTNAIHLTTTPASVGSATWLAIFPGLILIGFIVLSLWYLPKIQKYVLSIQPVFLNALISITLGGFIFSQTYFGMEDAYHYVNAFGLFWLKYGFGLAAAVLYAFKQFLSTDYAKHQEEIQNQADKASAAVAAQAAAAAVPPTPPAVQVPPAPPGQ